MDQLKSSRLIQFNGLIVDMVSYMDICNYLIVDGLTTAADHETFLKSLKEHNNSFVMANITTILAKRRGGFDKFVEILRQTDYIWLAEQIDPNCDFSKSKVNKLHAIQDSFAIGKRFTKLSGLKISRRPQSEPAFKETVYTTYRASYASEVSSVATSVSSKRRESFPIGMNKDPLEINCVMRSLSMAENCSQHESSDNDKIESHSNINNVCADAEEPRNNGNAVILYNLPECKTKTNDTQYIVGLTEKLGLPRKILNGLKVIRIGRIEKDKTKSSARPVKAKFKTEKARDRFLDSVMNHETVLKTEFGEVKVLPYKRVEKKQHWYQRIRFRKL